MRRAVFLSILLVFLLAGTSWAVDYDDLFGGDLLVEVEEDAGALAPEEALLVQDRLAVGGSYSFNLQATRPFLDGKAGDTSLSGNLGTQVYLDARPDPNFRLFAKAGISYALSEKLTPPREEHLEVKLQELFADFNYDNKVFFRAGKQNVKWGVGYFFSPADIINIGRIDPLDPEAEREGPAALKIHYPKGSSNYYLYALFDDVKELQDLALAPKMEFVAGKTEFGLGAFYQRGKHPRLMATVSSSFGEVGFFGEAVLSFSSDRGFLEPKGPVYEVVQKDGLFVQATAGGMYRYQDRDGRLDLAATLQYYFLGSLALMGSGRHYLAASLTWNRIFGSKLTASTLVLANLSDQSGLVSATLRLPSHGKFSPSVGIRSTFGAPGTEYGAAGRAVTVYAAVSVGGSF
ncbi:MAG TPA: hypothetical protein PLM25_08705 [Limnochordia bacterium]|nr:hypothetical protein [Limnochordia bacterium]